MENFSWIAPLKEAVLVLYSLIFSGILLWTYHLRNAQELGNLPFTDEEVPQ